MVDTVVRANGLQDKLLAFAELINNKLCESSSTFKKSSYKNIRGVLNAVIVDGDPVGRSVIQGEGAGPEATTSALVSDLSSILRAMLFSFLYLFEKSDH